MKSEKTAQEKIAFSLMVKHSEPVAMVRRCLASVAPVVDAIFVTITKNSPDDDIKAIEEVAKEFNATISIFDWVDNFATARNFAFDQISKEEFAYIYWQDVDDVLQGIDKFPQILQETISNNWDAVFFSYWYSVDLDANGKVREIVIEHKRERVIRNDGAFKWIGRIHETLIEQRQTTKVYRTECVVVHLTTSERLDVNIDRNIAILETTIKEENRKDPRTVMYLAKAYFDRSRFQKKTEDADIDRQMSKNLFIEYLEGAGNPGTPEYRESSGWDEERSSAWSYLGDIFRIENQLNQAIKCGFNALGEDPKFPSYYLDLAMTYSMQRKWQKADHWLKLGMNMPMPNTTLITNPRDLKSRALEIDYHVAVANNDLERALNAAQQMSDILPNIPDIKNRVIEAGKLKEANQAAQSLVYLTRYLEAVNEPHKITNLLGAIPQNLQQEQFASQLKNKYTPARIWDNNEVTIVCGPGFEKWSPKNVKDGIGGSEEAVIYLSKELSQLGYKVTVYADPRDDAGEYEGVTYKSWHELNTKDNFNILILWRNIAMVDSGVTAKQTYLWLHDVPANPEFTEARVNKVDKIFVLSEYHKSLLRMAKNGVMVPMPDEKVIVTSNGITPVVVNKKWDRDPNRLIWTSSYDRGLPYLLNMWGDIKKEVPSANLHIYYGWNLYDYIHGQNPARIQWKTKVEEMMKQDGIVHHGRVGHSELHKALAGSAIWSYPTDFQEISCISGMKAQAYGALPVCTDFAALKETIFAGKKVNVDITTTEGQEEYKKALIDTLKNPPTENERQQMMETAKEKYLWSNVAKTWDELFKTKGNK